MFSLYEVHVKLEYSMSVWPITVIMLHPPPPDQTYWTVSSGSSLRLRPVASLALHTVNRSTVELYTAGVQARTTIIKSVHEKRRIQLSVCARAQR